VGRFRVSTKSELQPIEFLVDGDDIHLSLATEIKRIGLNIKIDFSELEVKTAMSSILQTVERWEAYPPFNQDNDLKLEYLSMSSNGLSFTRKMIENTKRLLPYLSPTTKYNSTHPCVVTPRTLSTDKYTRADFNIKKRWSHIEASWTPTTIRADKSQANTLLLFANYLNDMGVSLYYETLELLQILEQLSDGYFPEILRPDIENSDCVPEESGEGYRIRGCTKTELGLCCELETVIPKQLETYIQTYPVHYDNIRLKLCNNCFYIKDKDTGNLKYANCSARKSMNMDFPICEFATLEKECLKFLQESKIPEIIQNCRFESAIPETLTLLPKQGVFLQGSADITVSSGAKSVSERIPYIIYSPDPITVRHSGQEITVPGSSNITQVQISVSALSDADIKSLKRRFYWTEFKHDWGTDDSLRVTLLSLQILFVPISIGLSVFLFIRNKAKIAHMASFTKGHNPKENFEENRKMLKTVRKK